MTDHRQQNDRQSGLVTDTVHEPAKPPLYKVLMLNDDYTPMEFVVQALETFFGKSRAEASRITVQIHRSGLASCGTFTYELAETKVAEVIACARQNQHPLQCTLERE